MELLERLNAAPVAPAPAAPAAPTAVKVKPERPSIDIDTTESEWLVFHDNWSRFKRMSHITARTDIIDNLRQCCTPQLNRRLFDMKGPTTLDAATEENLLSWLKDIAVKGLHMEVHRTGFVSLRQKQGELTNAYLAKLKSKATLCEFHVQAPAQCNDNTCNCTNHGLVLSYEDDMVATQLVAGIYNDDHQVKVLSESSNLTTLDEKVKRLLILEKSDASLSSLTSGDGFTNESYVQSRPRNNNRNKTPKKRPDLGDQCRDCKKRHPKCEVCGYSHKCMTKCNLSNKMGHIRT